MSVLLIAIVTIALLWAGSHYWRAPIAFKSQPLTPHLSDLQPVAESDVHPQFRGVLEQYRASLVALGFVPAPILVNKRQSPPDTFSSMSTPNTVTSRR